MVLLLGSEKAGREYIHVSTDGELDARELVRHLCEVCGGSGGRSAVWTRRERTRSNDKEVV